MDLQTWLTDLISHYEEYIFWLVLLFGIAHPLTENPWSFFTLSVALSGLGIPLGYTVIVLGNVIGIFVLYVVIHGIRWITNDALLNHRISRGVINWIETTATWRHIIVIGMPSVPTYPIKIALPVSNMSFIRYSYTLLGSYLFLYIANSLLYFGILGIFTDVIPRPLAIGLVVLFASYIYFGKELRHQYKKRKEEVHE